MYEIIIKKKKYALHPVKVLHYEVFFFFFKFNLCTCRLVQRGIGVIGENHDILSKKSTNRCNFDLCCSCLGD